MRSEDQAMLAQLTQHQQRFGHTQVSYEEPALWAWCHRKRVWHRHGNIGPDVQSKLDELGFSWTETTAVEAPPQAHLLGYEEKELRVQYLICVMLVGWVVMVPLAGRLAEYKQIFLSFKKHNPTSLHHARETNHQPQEHSS